MAGRDTRVRVGYARHTIPDYAVEEHCRKCPQKAAHKIEETSGPASFHPLTAYLCCFCFQQVVGYDCAAYPYDADDQLGGWKVTP